MEENSTRGLVVELDSLETLDLIVGADSRCAADFPELAEQLDMSEIQVEPWSSVVEEMEELFPLHWKEIAVFQDEIALKCDRERYAALEKAGALLVITARADKKLIGYFVSFVLPHPHYQGSGLWAMTDMYFVLPEYRTGTGLKLFVAFEEIVRAKGVVQAVTSCKLHQDHTPLLEKLGWTWTDKTFQKHLKA
jgi:hypothetical protein